MLCFYLIFYKPQFNLIRHDCLWLWNLFHIILRRMHNRVFTLLTIPGFILILRFPVKLISLVVPRRNSAKKVSVYHHKKDANNERLYVRFWWAPTNSGSENAKHYRDPVGKVSQLVNISGAGATLFIDPYMPRVLVFHTHVVSILIPRHPQDNVSDQMYQHNMDRKCCKSDHV